MEYLLPLLPALPIAGFVVLALAGPRFSPRGVAAIGVGSIGCATLFASALTAAFLLGPVPQGALDQQLWEWMHLTGFSARIGLRLDALSLVMTLVVTFVSFLIHLYSTEYMAGDEGYSRFFAYLNLFVASMLVLVLADNLLLLYLGWEGVGLCSYLLIGFWYREPANGRAAQKAFIVTRVGDTAMAIGLFLLVVQLGTLDIQAVQQRAREVWGVGSAPALAAAALLLGGALGKSAQLPLQVWLPDAMAGPTPVSALIHAATMVTAGVYLIARTHGLFELAPPVQAAVAWIGAVTLLLAGASALVQRDLKRALAYSTISQIGYMFLGLGVGAYSAAIFHLATHAFFKALLFLGAGAVILALHHEQDLFRMGGLRRRLPLVFWTFLAGAASLAGLPLVTAGFYSKDWILWEAWAAGGPGRWLWAMGLLGAWLTALYAFRLVALVFLGEARTPPGPGPGFRMQFPLVVLASGALLAGFLEIPRTLGDVPLFSTLLAPVLPMPARLPAPLWIEGLFQLVAALAALTGIALGLWLFANQRAAAAASASPAVDAARHLWSSGWGFDWLYDRLLVRPLLTLSLWLANDPADRLYRGVAWLSRLGSTVLSRSQSGTLRRYAGVIAAGAALFVGLVLLR